MEEKKENMRAAKKLAILGVSAGVAYIITQGVKFVCPSGGNLLEKAGILIGGGVLSAMVADKASDYAEGKLDKAISKIEETVSVEVVEEAKVEIVN